MKEQKRRISSTQRNLIIGLIISILVLAVLLYFYHNHWKGNFIVNDVPTSITGVAIIFVISANLITTAVLGGILLSALFPAQSKTQKEIEKLSDTFEPVQFKDFEYFTLSNLVSSENVKALAKKDKNGKITINISVIHEIDDTELFVKHFKI